MQDQIRHILRQEVQEFILVHENEDEQKLLLSRKSVFDIPTPLIINQIIGRRKAKEKFPSLYKTYGIIYPPALNIEQSSSEASAGFKAEIIKDLQSVEKNTLADITGGFGIDCLKFSNYFNVVNYVEPNAALLEIVRHNFNQLGVSNVIFQNTDAEQFLQTATNHLNWIYADPSRRNSHNKKLVLLSDCSPDVTTILTLIFKSGDYFLVKASPLLDIQHGITSLKKVVKVYVVSIDDECKELLFVCGQEPISDPEIIAVNLTSNGRIMFSFSKEQEQRATVQYSQPKKYLYEPNASVLKAGAFRSVAVKFNLFKLHQNTHFYTSDKLMHDFPGRKFLVEDELRLDTKIFKSIFPEGKANVTTRNYPLSSEGLKKKAGLKDGGEKFLIGFTGPEKKYLILASRI